MHLVVPVSLTYALNPFRRSIVPLGGKKFASSAPQGDRLVF